MKKRRNYRRFLFVLLFVNLIGIGVLGYQKVKNSIPDEVHVRNGDEDALNGIISDPWVTYDDTLSVAGSNSYTIKCKLFDFIPLKTVKVQAVEDTWVYASGTPIGLYMETSGVLIVDAGEVVGADGIPCQPAEHIVQAGDYILSVNGSPIEGKRQLIDLIHQSSGESMEIIVERNGEDIPLSLTPVLTEDDSYKLGIWVRDNTQGIGTLTYVDDERRYGALGHGISDLDTGELLHIGKGELYEAQILSVMKGTKGNPGELTGVINYQSARQIGTIAENSPIGIFGEMDESKLGSVSLKSVQVGLKQEVSAGKASVLTTVDGQVGEYEIEITDIFWDASDTNKAFSIRVTDPKLLAYSGGIVQGMSGSPILQNGKIIGAVTHVFVQDSTKGYGIFLESML